MNSRSSIVVLILSAGLLTLASSAFSDQSQVESRESSQQHSPKSYVNSTQEAYQAMQSLPTDEPLDMLNMIRFRNAADYHEDSEFAGKNWTGEQAYREYGKHSSPILASIGGKASYAAVPQLTLIGPEHEAWDVVFIVSYPNVAAFLKFVNDPEYQKHAFHRKAAVADSRLIRLLPQSTDANP